MFLDSFPVRGPLPIWETVTGKLMPHTLIQAVSMARPTLKAKEVLLKMGAFPIKLMLKAKEVLFRLGASPIKLMLNTKEALLNLGISPTKLMLIAREVLLPLGMSPTISTTMHRTAPLLRLI